MTASVTNETLAAKLDALDDKSDERHADNVRLLTRIDARIDALSERNGHIEIALAQHGQRLTSLEKEVFNRRRGDSSSLVNGPTWKMLGIGLAALISLGWGVAEALIWVKRMISMFGTGR